MLSKAIINFRQLCQNRRTYYTLLLGTNSPVTVALIGNISIQGWAQSIRTSIVLKREAISIAEMGRH